MKDNTKFTYWTFAAKKKSLKKNTRYLFHYVRICGTQSKQRIVAAWIPAAA